MPFLSIHLFTPSNSEYLKSLPKLFQFFKIRVINQRGHLCDRYLV
jgi:hypothetical protein